MSSPPTTPPAEPPQNLKSWRFKPTYIDCEWAEKYRPGGFHPVSLGDTFRDGVYEVVRKLGYGAFSTVWLAVDTRSSRHVALKIMAAKDSNSDTELSILDHLSKRSHRDSNSQHLMFPLHVFTHKGPNGAHRCMTFEPMGTTVTPRTRGVSTHESRPYHKWMAKKTILHALRGLAFLHSNGIVHGDVQPGNMLFAIGDLSTVQENDLAQSDTNTDTTIPLERLDGKVDRWAPRSVYLGLSLNDYVKTDVGSLEVKLSDLGAAFWETDPPSKAVTPASLRAPEIILNRQPYTGAIDIWSFGCLIFEFLTGTSLFLVMTVGPTQDEVVDDHLLQLHDIMGPLPEDVMAAWPRASRYLGPDQKRLRPNSGYVNDPLEVFFSKSKSDEFDDAEAATVCALIRRILAYDPAVRPTAMELLKNLWFSA